MCQTWSRFILKFMWWLWLGWKDRDVWSAVGLTHPPIMCSCSKICLVEIICSQSDILYHIITWSDEIIHGLSWMSWTLCIWYDWKAKSLVSVPTGETILQHSMSRYRLYNYILVYRFHTETNEMYRYIRNQYQVDLVYADCVHVRVHQPQVGQANVADRSIIRLVIDVARPPVWIHSTIPLHKTWPQWQWLAHWSEEPCDHHQGEIYTLYSLVYIGLRVCMWV